MAGKFRILAATLLGLAGALVAAPSGEPSGAMRPGGGLLPGRPSQPRPVGPRKEDNSPEMQNVRKAVDALGPEQRKRFAENLVRWANLPPEQKKALRDHEEMRKQFMEEEIKTALKESGLQLDGERREQFIKRYGEERRKIEEQLRADMMEKRKPLVRELLGRLKTEFSSTTPRATR